MKDKYKSELYRTSLDLAFIEGIVRGNQNVIEELIAKKDYDSIRTGSILGACKITLNDAKIKIDKCLDRLEGIQYEH